MLFTVLFQVIQTVRMEEMKPIVPIQPHVLMETLDVVTVSVYQIHGNVMVKETALIYLMNMTVLQLLLHQRVVIMRYLCHIFY